MKIAIVGHPRENKERIQRVSELFSHLGASITQVDKEEGTSNDATFLHIFQSIDNADLVVAVPLEGLTLDYVATGAIAYAKHLNKQVFIYYG